MIMEEKRRHFGLDLLRALAIVSVLGGHFFLNTPFSIEPFQTVSMLTQGCVQCLFTNIGVPLFLMLTGFLNCHKKLERGFYSRIWRVLSSYFFISVITYLTLNHRVGYSISAFVRGVLSFHTINYAWYVEMYIGLFLLIPFLNLLWSACLVENGQRNCRYLIGTLAFLSVIPIFTNRYNLYLFPQYWTTLWILVYYFLGAYIRTFYSEQPPLWFSSYKVWWGLLCAGICMFNAVVTFCIFSKHDYIAFLGNSSCPMAVILTFLLFLMFYRVQTIPFGKLGIKKLSEYSLDIYLFSYMFDQLIYPWVMKHLFVSQSQIFAYYIPIVGSVLLCSLAAAVLKEKLFSGAHFIWLKVYENRHRS